MFWLLPEFPSPLIGFVIAACFALGQLAEPR